jgi:hypothetical protein
VNARIQELQSIQHLNTGMILRVMLFATGILFLVIMKDKHLTQEHATAHAQMKLKSNLPVSIPNFSVLNVAASASISVNLKLLQLKAVTSQCSGVPKRVNANAKRSSLLEIVDP